jgi:phage shock protein C
MYCTRCGIALDDSARFCSQCGKPTGLGGAVPPPANEWAASRRLVRPMHQKKIAGVCAGFAYYMDVDVTLMRIIWLLVAIFTGVGFIAYLIAWIAMPKDYTIGAPAEKPSATPAPTC